MYSVRRLYFAVLNTVFTNPLSSLLRYPRLISVSIATWSSLFLQMNLAFLRRVKSNCLFIFPSFALQGSGLNVLLFFFGYFLFEKKVTYGTLNVFICLI